MGGNRVRLHVERAGAPDPAEEGRTGRLNCRANSRVRLARRFAGYDHLEPFGSWASVVVNVIITAAFDSHGPRRIDIRTGIGDGLWIAWHIAGVNLVLGGGGHRVYRSAGQVVSGLSGEGSDLG